MYQRDTASCAGLTPVHKSRTRPFHGRFNGPCDNKEFAPRKVGPSIYYRSFNTEKILRATGKVQATTRSHQIYRSNTRRTAKGECEWKFLAVNSGIKKWKRRYVFLLRFVPFWFKTETSVMRWFMRETIIKNIFEEIFM